MAPPFVSWSSDHIGWLHDLLDYLPKLQSLLVHHSAIVDREVVKYLSSGANLSLFAAPTQKIWCLCLLSMTELTNVSSDCLAATIACFPQLVYLDLSYSTAAGKYTFIQQLSGARLMLTLKILKLRGVGLGDRSISSIAVSVGTGLWSLDVGENCLTDGSVQTLLDHCFLPPDYGYPAKYFRNTSESMSDCAQDDQEEIVLRDISKCKRTSGLTHLRISDNDISAGAILELVAASRLHVLDCSRQKGLALWGYYKGDPTRSAYQVVQVLRHLAQDRFSSAGSLRYLRINHQLVTGDCGLLDILEKERAASHIRGLFCWPSWVSADFHDSITETALPTMGLRTLVLTGLPHTSNTGWVAKGLQAFVNHCASLEASAREVAANPQDDPESQDTINAQHGGEPSSTTDGRSAANLPHGAGAHVFDCQQCGAGSHHTRCQQCGAETECPVYSPTPETQATATKPRNHADASSPEDPHAQPALEPQTSTTPPHSSSPNTAPALPPTRTTLRTIYLEFDNPRPADPNASDMYAMRVAARGDFSFFHTDPPGPDQTITGTLPEENPWRGDIVPVLRAQKARARYVWSGDVVAVRK